MKKIKVTILTMATLQMISAGLMAAMSSVAEAFPRASDVQVQLAFSVSGIAVLISSLFTDKIYQKFKRRNCAIFGLALLIVVAILANIFNSSLVCVYCYSLLLGVALSLYIPAISSVIIDCFENEQKAKLIGQQSAFCSIGGIVSSLVGGWLAVNYWYRAYLLLLMCLPALVLAILYFPKDNQKENKQETKQERLITKVDKNIVYYSLITLAFLVIYGVCNNNLSLFVAQEGFGNTVITGMLGSIGMLGGVVGGMIFGKYISKYGDKVTPIIFLLLAIMFLVLYSTDNIIVLALIVFILGVLQCIMMPRSMLSLSEKINPTQSVLASSLICAVMPNLSGVITPLIVTNLSTVFFGGTIRSRFMIAAIMAIVIATTLGYKEFKSKK